MTKRNEKNSHTESKLDQWISQTLQEGSRSEPPEQKIVHKPAPKIPKRGKFKKQRPQKGAKGKLFHKQTKFRHSKHKGKLKIIPLSGLSEVGRNCMILEYEKDIIVIDMGFQFPEADFLGVDYVIPDTTYLEERKKNLNPRRSQLRKRL